MSAFASEAVVTTVLLVRHGEATNNRDQRIGGWSDLPLTDLGRAQAAAAGRALAGERFDAIWTSDLPRARATAEAIAAYHALPLVDAPGLRERSLGVLDGLTFAEAKARYPALARGLLDRTTDALPEGGETMAGVFGRVAATVDRVVTEHAGGRVVLVSHGIALYHAFCHVVGLGEPSADHQLFTLVGNASISELAHRRSASGRDRWHLERWNDATHLVGVGAGAAAGLVT